MQKNKQKCNKHYELAQIIWRNTENILRDYSNIFKKYSKYFEGRLKLFNKSFLCLRLQEVLFSNPEIGHIFQDKRGSRMSCVSTQNKFCKSIQWKVQFKRSSYLNLKVLFYFKPEEVSCFNPKEDLLETIRNLNHFQNFSNYVQNYTLN